MNNTTGIAGKCDGEHFHSPSGGWGQRLIPGVPMDQASVGRNWATECHGDQFIRPCRPAEL